MAELLREYLAQFEMAPVFSEEEVLHYLLPVEGVIDSYVVEGPGVFSRLPSMTRIQCFSPIPCTCRAGS